MTDETKQRAFRKLETFRPKIGYPDEFRDYSKLDVQPATTCSATCARSPRSRPTVSSRKIGGPVDRDEWFMLPQHVNAYYNPGMNEICFPAGILQPPFFDADAEPAENYGGIGAVIGHEVGHGFDDQGSQYDELGQLENWWTADDRAAFQERADKLIAQYDGYEPAELPGEHVNGALTVGENIGDLGGITIALKAYLISLEGEEPPEVGGLPAPSGCSSTSRTSGAPSGARSSCCSCSPSTRTAPPSSAPTSCATSTSSTTRSARSRATASGSTRRTASASGSALTGCRPTDATVGGFISDRPPAAPVRQRGGGVHVLAGLWRGSRSAGIRQSATRIVADQERVGERLRHVGVGERQDPRGDVPAGVDGGPQRG